MSGYGGGVDSILRGHEDTGRQRCNVSRDDIGDVGAGVGRVVRGGIGADLGGKGRGNNPSSISSSSISRGDSGVAGGPDAGHKGITVSLLSIFSLCRK